MGEDQGSNGTPRGNSRAGDVPEAAPTQETLDQRMMEARSLAEVLELAGDLTNNAVEIVAQDGFEAVRRAQTNLERSIQKYIKLLDDTLADKAQGAGGPGATAYRNTNYGAPSDDIPGGRYRSFPDGVRSARVYANWATFYQRAERQGKARTKGSGNYSDLQYAVGFRPKSVQVGNT